MAESFKLFDQFKAAEMLGISQSTLRRMPSEGDGPQFVRVGKRRIVYSQEALKRWAALRTFPQAASGSAQLAA